MSKWEDSFKKTIPNGNDVNNQMNGLFIPNRQLSIVVAGLLFLFFAVFITGYFLGKRYACEQFMQQMHAENGVDKELSATQVMNDGDKNMHDEMRADDTSELVAVLPDAISEKDDETFVLPAATDVQGQSRSYYAQLIGFGTEKAAQKFAQKLASKNIETVVKTHTNKSVKGRVAHWYQVVTVPYTNKDELSELVAQLVKDEKLRDVAIRSC
jgi:sporulation related protein